MQEPNVLQGVGPARVVLVGKWLGWIGALTMALGAAWLTWAVILYFQWTYWLGLPNLFPCCPARYPEMVAALIVLSTVLTALGGRTLWLGLRFRGLFEPG